MDQPDRDHAIKIAQDRLISTYLKRPSFAKSTSRVTATIEEGVTCTVGDGHHTVVSDLPEAMGGDDAGPTPGFFARAGIASCVAMAIKTTAARAGHKFCKVNVNVETDFDDRRTYGLCAGSAAPIETRVIIDVECDLTQEEASAFIRDVLEYDTWFLGLRDAQSVATVITARQGA